MLWWHIWKNIVTMSLSLMIRLHHYLSLPYLVVVFLVLRNTNHCLFHQESVLPVDVSNWRCTWHRFGAHLECDLYYADCFNAISCPIYLIRWIVLHHGVAICINLWLATNRCNYCLYYLIMLATMISCPLTRIYSWCIRCMISIYVTIYACSNLIKVYQ